MKTTVTGENRFENDATRYAAYLETPEGRLRGDLTFANVQDFLPAAPGIKSLSALDLACGTGAAAVRLARRRIHVIFLDSSPAMLELAERAVVDSGVSDKVTIKQCDVNWLAEIFHAPSLDIILCHNLLEYVDDPAAVLRVNEEFVGDNVGP